MNWIGFVLFAAGAFVVCFNLYVSIIRYLLHLARGGTRASFRFVSGIGGAGSVFLSIGAILLRPTRLSWAAAVLFFIDTGGLFRFAVVMCRMGWRSRRSGGEQR